MSNDLNPSESSIMQQLTAYLDGELENAERDQVEERLSNDQKYRSLMQQLQKTWDALDILPTSKVNHSFTQSTMKLVVNDAKKVATQNATNPWTWTIRILALILIPFAASAGAFVANRYFQSIPHRQLQTDLDVIKDYDVLTCDENLSIDFLEALVQDRSIFGMTTPLQSDKRLNLYDQEIPDLASLMLLEDFEKGVIRSNRAKFNKLDRSQQNKIRQLHQKIQSHSKCDMMTTMLFEYSFWLAQQSESDADRIRYIKDIDFKIDEIKQIVDDQFLPIFASQLQQADLETIYLGLIYLTDKQRSIITNKFLELFTEIEELELIIDADKKFGEKQSKSPNYQTYLSGNMLKKIYDRFPDQIEQIVPPDLVDEIKMATISLPAKQVLEIAANMTDEFPGGEQIRQVHLMTRWLLLAMDEHFQTSPKDENEFFQSLPQKQQEQLNNEFPEDKKRMVRELWETKFGQNL